MKKGEYSDSCDEVWGMIFFFQIGRDQAPLVIIETFKANKRMKRLTVFVLSEIVIQRDIKARTKIVAFANEQKKEGLNETWQFIVNRGPRVL